METGGYNYKALTERPGNLEWQRDVSRDHIGTFRRRKCGSLVGFHQPELSVKDTETQNRYIWGPLRGATIQAKPSLGGEVGVQKGRPILRSWTLGQQFAPPSASNHSLELPCLDHTPWLACLLEPCTPPVSAMPATTASKDSHVS